MEHTFTQNDLVAYVYGESAPAQLEATEAALAADPILISDMVELVEAQASLPRVRFNPRARILKAIRRYATGEPSPRLCY